MNRRDFLSLAGATASLLVLPSIGSAKAGREWDELEFVLHDWSDWYMSQPDRNWRLPLDCVQRLMRLESNAPSWAVGTYGWKGTLTRGHLVSKAGRREPIKQQYGAWVYIKRTDTDYLAECRAAFREQAAAVFQGLWPSFKLNEGEPSRRLLSIEARLARLQW